MKSKTQQQAQREDHNIIKQKKNSFESKRNDFFISNSQF